MIGTAVSEAFGTIGLAALSPPWCYVTLAAIVYAYHLTKRS